MKRLLIIIAFTCLVLGCISPSIDFKPGINPTLLEDSTVNIDKVVDTIDMSSPTANVNDAEIGVIKGSTVTITGANLKDIKGIQITNSKFTVESIKLDINIPAKFWVGVLSGVLICIAIYLLGLIIKKKKRGGQDGR